MIKILIVDDQELIRQSLELMLSSRSQFKIVGTASDGREAIAMTRKFKPDIILMDIRMPEIDGIECIKIIKENYKEIKIIVLTTFDDEEYIFESFKHGANGFLLKGISINELVHTIETVYKGGSLVEPKVASKVLALFSQMAKSDYISKVDSVDISSLSINELKIIQFIGRGMSNKEITIKMNFSEGTIRNYISNILTKLNLRDRTQIAIFAIQSSIMIREFEE
ncbi:MAG: DNA-binding response regulator [Firmicutes bacterium HGW-Firmicutes-1]|jgi:DNA-binding NarL/FixJ family response regulator|nr:MAG: DNA-binding response regulator [Firmicutes bacterium HGW-Firmicutes-1]